MGARARRSAHLALDEGQHTIGPIEGTHVATAGQRFDAIAHHLHGAGAVAGDHLEGRRRGFLVDGRAAGAHDAPPGATARTVSARRSPEGAIQSIEQPAFMPISAAPIGVITEIRDSAASSADG